jgi:chromosome partitioning protein
MSIITFVNQKGGVGKTSTCIMIAKLLAKNNSKVLLIDLDNQENLSSTFGFESRDDLNSSYELFFKEDVASIINKTEDKNIDIIIANGKSVQINSELEEEVFKIKYSISGNKFNYPINQILVKKLKEIKNYDYILIDCPATINTMIKTALIVSDIVLVPINTDSFSINGVIKLTNIIEDIKLNLNDHLKLRIFLNKYESHLPNHLKAYEMLRTYLNRYVAKTTIPKRKMIQDTVEQLKDLYKFNNKQSIAIANQYVKLFNEVIKNENGR